MEAAFYVVSSGAYFLGVVGLVNSLRLAGHTEPIFLLDCGLTSQQREALDPEVTVFPAPNDSHPSMLKAFVPLRHPAKAMVLIDADMIVTRPLSGLIEQACSGNVVAFENNIDRFVPEWGELLELGPIRLQPYLSSGLVALGRSPGEEVLRLLEDRVRRVDFGLSYFGKDVPEYPLLYLDQDVLNAILASRVKRDRLVVLEHRLLPEIPFDGLRVTDDAEIGCAYEDGTEPYVVHHCFSPKPWQKPAYDGVYSRLLRRLLCGADAAVKVPRRDIPMGLRTGPLSSAERLRAKAGAQVRWRLGGWMRERFGVEPFESGRVT
jgi:hypothetical protein